MSEPRDTKPSPGFKGTEQQLSPDWTMEETYWRDNWRSRPYASADLGFDYYRPAYRYGFESATKFSGRKWDDIQSDLRSGWERYEYRGSSAWDKVKDAVRDAWNRVTNRS
jgi:hypothetical protein